ncbi:peptidase P60 [Pseudomonas sp. HMWF032]|uniref:C40 family peptidase n=1 Tax=unclassified Pseudomonas TaxID=196821 RepID=UPI000D3B6B80|nr:MULTISPECIES: C40 family peptidase [unclassified Pseudomonas]PTS84455.1 peptidase P60 [Pseudomonas sp. HMWF032]PTT83799.1 peptidase P60 [Pseudomonas sp. HMWF010]WAC44354.1 C40 family peptidase [Pseudomonas sp. SL4(2022)]
MLKRLAPLVPLALSMVLAACANHAPQSVLSSEPEVFSSTDLAGFDEQAKEAALGDFTEEKSYKLPQLADSILSHGLSLVGTRYRFGGVSVSSGFDCSGFIGYLFKEEAGMQLPRSSRDMINIDAPLVSRDELKPGDLLFFSTSGRNRVSHAGIYMGDNQFIHSSSSRSGGVRVDSLEDRYWKRTFIEAKRALAMAPGDNLVRHP